MLTACGIETSYAPEATNVAVGNSLQQCLPLAVLKLTCRLYMYSGSVPSVATVLTACGIETRQSYPLY